MAEPAMAVGLWSEAGAAGWGGVATCPGRGPEAASPHALGLKHHNRDTLSRCDSHAVSHVEKFNTSMVTMDLYGDIL